MYKHGIVFLLFVLTSLSNVSAIAFSGGLALPHSASQGKPAITAGNRQSENVPQQERRQEQQWVDSVMGTLTLRQRIAQLFVVPLEAVTGKRNNTDEVLELVTGEHIGGVIVMKALPQGYAESINRLQAHSRTPLLVAMDGEWGVAMRTDSVLVFPRQMMLGALSDDKLVEQMGAAVAAQYKRMGIHLNFSPVVDVNNNPNNPVINIRSFGEDKYNVARKSRAYMHGLQNGGILACAKHFPGHGDTDQDSHERLPSINHPALRIDSLELYPFRALLEGGVDAVMVAHLRVPAYDTVQRPSTLSPFIVNRLLRDELAFPGLIVTDALNMKAVTSAAQKDAIALQALLAGNDVLLMPEKVRESITLIEQAVGEGMLSEHRLNMKCRKMLAAKYRAGLSRYQPVDSVHLLEDLNGNAHRALRYRLTEQAITLLKNNNNLLPLQRLDTLNIAYVEIGKKYGRFFEEQLRSYARVTPFSIDPGVPADTLAQLARQLAPYNLVVVGYHNTDARPQFNFGVDSVVGAFIARLAEEKKVVLDFFGTPYGITKFKDIDHVEALMVSYENTQYSQERSAQLLFGGVAARGTLPVSIDSLYPSGSGIVQLRPTRLHYVLPEEVGIATRRLHRVDSLVTDAIMQHATPGAQVMAIYKGEVFYNKTFGNHVYDSVVQVVPSDLYDWASLTKITATLPVIMSLVDRGAIDLDTSLGAYLPELLHTNKSKLVMTELLTHSAGLKAFQPFQRAFLPNSRGLFDTASFSRTWSKDYPLPVAGHLYASLDVSAFIHKQINNSPLLGKTYRYSDWGFIYLQQVVENITGKTLDFLADSLFYRPLGMHHTGYLPLRYVEKNRIVPTEIDTAFRRQCLQGTVHDPTAALLGGVAGHAGVFGNANDLAKLLQLYLNSGVYGGERYFADSTVKRFTGCYYCAKGIRRGLGFDKPEPRKDKESPVGREWSLLSYGHSGYTGNLCWVDPERELIVIFLSNRSYPHDDKKLNRLRTRPQIFSEFVKIVDEREQKHGQ